MAARRSAERAAGGAPRRPALDKYLAGGGAWNDDEVAARAALTPDEVVAAYTKWHDEALASTRALPADALRRAGALPWYGAEYDLEDYVAYAVYGHKREHSAQIQVVRDQFG